MNSKCPGSFRPIIREGIPDSILAILKACTRYDDGPEHGAEGDLTFGRPNIASLLNMMTSLSDATAFQNASFKIRKRMNNHKRKEEQNKQRIEELVEMFMLDNHDELDSELKTIPQDSLCALLVILIPYIERHAALDTTFDTFSDSTCRRVNTFESLKLAPSANSLDEFLTLIRLHDFKDSLLTMDIGVNLIEIATSVAEGKVDVNTFLDTFEAMGRSEANRLVKYLKRNHAARAAKE